MRIAELSSPSPEHPPPSGDSQIQLLLSQIESSIHRAENLTLDSSSTGESIAADLRLRLTHLTKLALFTNSALKLHLWKLSYRLWNACVDLSNTAANSSINHRTVLAQLRHIAADILHLAGKPSGVPSPTLKCASFFYKTGSIYHDLRNFDLASTCFERAADLVARIESESVTDAAERRLLLDLHIARSRTAWELSDLSLAVNLLARAKKFLFGCVHHYKALASQYLVFGKSVLAASGGDCSKSNSDANESLKLMNEALELCDKALSASRTRDEVLELKLLRSKALRFTAAVNLQVQEYESVLKCIKVLRESGDGDHPSLPVLAVKAWLGLERYGEAEKELKSMVVNKCVPEGIWVSAVEAYFQAAGAAGAETVKGVFMGLLGRCQVSAASALRIVNRLIGENAGGSLEGADMRAKVVAELVSEERVVALFAGENVAKERTTLHAMLWNCAADHFRSKKYDTSAEIFEKSILYVPFDIENRWLRAKSHRVLGLCHLGLYQLDQAQEYINEAEKLEPNAVCAFLKFKILLQKKDYKEAMDQIKALTSCLDFTTDFLSLSAHEAVACHAFSVAVTSLSNLLDLNSSGSPMKTSEVLVLRTIITILSQSKGQEQEILRFMKLAHTRMTEIGAECFFGKGEVGRRERNWFATTSWTTGQKLGTEENNDLCAEFFMLAAEFYSVKMNGQEGEDTAMVCKSLILAVSSMLATESQGKCILTELDVKKAGELLDRVGKMLPSVASGSGAARFGDDPAISVEANLIFIYTSSAFDIYGRLNDAASQQNLIQKFASSSLCSPDYLLEIGLSASLGPKTNYDIASFALNKCLLAFLSSTSPDYKKVAKIIRNLVSLSSTYKGETDDDAVFSIYNQASRIMVGLREGQFPSEDGKWLAMTAWNRAALPVRLGQIDMARKWMKMGLELAGKVSGVENYRSCMEDFLSKFNSKLPNQERQED